MARHVRCQDDADETLAEGLEVVPGEVLQEVVLLLVKDGEGLGGVEVLLDRLVAVANGPVRDQVHVVGVREAVVAEIVANCRHADRKRVQFAHLHEFENVALGHEEVAHLEDVHSVHVVMVLNVASVALVNLPDKAGQLCLVHLNELVDFEDLKDVDGQDGQRGLAPQALAVLQRVEVDVVHEGQLLLVLLDVVVDCIDAGRATHRERDLRVLLSALPKLLDMGVQGGLAEDFEPHLRELVEPAFGQGGSPLQRQVERVKQRVVNVKDGALADFLDRVVDSLDELRLRVRCLVLVLNFPQQRNDFLGRRLQQVCVIHGAQFKRGRFDELLLEEDLEFGERQLVVGPSDFLLKSVLELVDVDPDGVEHLLEVVAGDAPGDRIALEDVFLDEGLHPRLVSHELFPL